jgi:hypothetical protein
VLRVWHNNEPLSGYKKLAVLRNAADVLHEGFTKPLVV